MYKAPLYTMILNPCFLYLIIVYKPENLVNIAKNINKKINYEYYK